VRFGFREYFDSSDGRGYGSDNFSWTAALFIDAAYENYLKTGEMSFKSRIRNILWRGAVLNRGKEPSRMPFGVISQNMLAAIKEIRSRYCTECGNVSYDVIRNSKEYKEYGMVTASLKGLDINKMEDEKEKLAFWINIYNALIIDGIIRVGIKSSVKEVVGFFSKVKYNIGGHDFSANDIEHGILRVNSRPPLRSFKQFGIFNPRKRYMVEKTDPRVHFALVCGSRSCAPINFYTSEGIEDELNLAAKNFINSSEVIVVPEDKRLLLSMIFKWYESDLGGREGVFDFIEKYIVDDDKRDFVKNNRNFLDIDYLYYDWNLNR